jgi:hypothetical protein
MAKPSQNNRGLGHKLRWLVLLTIPNSVLAVIKSENVPNAGAVGRSHRDSEPPTDSKAQGQSVGALAVIKRGHAQSASGPGLMVSPPKLYERRG